MLCESGTFWQYEGNAGAKTNIERKSCRLLEEIEGS